MWGSKAQIVRGDRQVKARTVSHLIGVMAPASVVLLLTGCAVGRNSIDDAALTGAISMADDTPSIATDPFGPDRGMDASATDRLIDEDTIRLAVTTADLNALVGDQLPWASAATGSTGTISAISQTELSGQTCRTFEAVRRAYDGVSLYNGEVCLDPRSGWWTRALAPVSGG